MSVRSFMGVMVGPKSRVRIGAALLCFSVGSARVFEAAPAAAQDARASSPSAVKSAESHFHRAVSLYKDGDYGGALVEFRRAYELAPNYRVLYNMGQALYQLQRYAEALTSFETYLAKGGAQISAARRTSVENDLRTLRTRVGHVAVTVSEDGVDVLVDDENVGTSPLKDPVLVSVGHRKITVSKAGRPPVDKFVDVAAGDSAKVAFDLSAPPAPPSPAPAPATEPPPTPAPQASAPAPAPDAPPPSSSGVPLWVPWTATGVLAAGTVVTGILALTSQSSLEQQLGSFPGNSAAISDDRNRAKAFAFTNDVLLGVTAVALGVSLYLTLVPPAADHGPAGSRSGATVGVALSPVGAALEGEY